MNITSYTIGRGFGALTENTAAGLRQTTGSYYSPHGLVSCYAEVSADGANGCSNVAMVLLGRQWNYGDRVYRGPLALARLAAKFARQIAASSHE